MKTEYEYIRFDDYTACDRKTKTFVCINRKHGAELGSVHWYGAWRQYVFVPISEHVVFSAGCLADIGDFIKQLMEARKTEMVASKEAQSSVT